MSYWKPKILRQALSFCLLLSGGFLIAQDSTGYAKFFRKQKNQLEIPYHSGANHFIRETLKVPNKKKAFREALGRATYYFPYLDSTLKANKLPVDLKFMALAMSGLKFDHFDTLDGARGLWHFKYQSAKISGLEIGSYIDERRDVQLSTEAFVKSIKSYHQIYQDWSLALAAYVSSAPSVNTAIRYNSNSTDYRKVQQDLEFRAKQVVDRFLAAYYLYHKKQELVLTPISMKRPDRTVSFRTGDWLSFKQVAQAMKTNESDLLWLNPSFKRGIVPDMSDSFTIRIPFALKDSIAAIQALKYEPYSASYFEASENTQKKTVKVSHKVAAGETLNSIAKKYKCSVEELKKWNNLEEDSIAVGQVLKVEKEVVTPKPPARKFIYHKVRSGETLSHIAARYRCRVSDIKRWNGLRSSRIYAGQRLRIYR